MGDGHDQNVVFNNSVNDPKREPTHGTLAMTMIHGDKSLGVGSHGAQSLINSLRKTSRRRNTLRRIPIKRFIKIAAGSGEIINRQHPTSLILQPSAV